MSEKTPFLSIIIVCLDPGSKLFKTLDSIRVQTFTDYEIVLKDGMSRDGSIDRLSRPGSSYDELPIRLIVRKDEGIYDAMNEALSYAKGKYVYFLNCGDTLSDREVLENVCGELRLCEDRTVLYGNIFEMKTKKIVTSNPRIDAFACYRNVPCHQACVYERTLLTEHPFRTEYKVRADYEHFLWCFFKAGARFVYRDLVIADYEGNGYSEHNETRSLLEHRKITAQYMGKGQILLYRLLLFVTLAPLRTALARNRTTTGFYNAAKKLLYGFRK